MIGIEHTVSLANPDIEPVILMPDADEILSGQSLQNIWNLYSSSDGTMHIGIWDCQTDVWQVH
ncbi:hypothetical protein [Reinekea sp.]|jgi:uncharacterized cupin superfamily protein|uniref:hypothetical protein n=1 Tax=Reinekea sp. TaxID=1970455 RepID=UPI002A7FBF5C|nr:hypothetical protein [Reinekea sp.]